MKAQKLASALLAATFTLAAGSAAAQAFPNKPIRIIVPYQAGGTSEMMARLVAESMQSRLGQPVVIENRPGGGTMIGATAMVQAPADGHTIFINASSFLINSHLVSKLPYDMKDFLPLTLGAANPHLLIAHSGLGVKSVRDFVALAKTPGKDMSYASFGNGSSGHLGFELLKKTYGFPMVHIPYKGVPAAVADVIAGNVQAMLTDLAPAVPQVKAGKLLGIAVAAPERTSALPDVPTFQESGGIPFQSRSWFGFMIRTGTPPEIVRTLHAEVVRGLQAQNTKERLSAVGMQTFGTTQAEFEEFMKAESAKFLDAIKFSGTKIE